MGKRNWGVDETFLPLGLGFEETENKKKMDFCKSVVYDLEQHFHTRPMSWHYMIFLAKLISTFPIKNRTSALYVCISK